MTQHETRRQAARESLAEQDVSLGVFGPGPNFQYLTGSSHDWRRFRDLGNLSTSLLLPVEGEPVIIAEPFGADETVALETIALELFEEPVPKIAAAVDELAGDGRVAVDPYANSSVVLAVLESGVPEVVPTAGAVERLRVEKDDDERRRLRDAARLTYEAVDELVQRIEPGKTMATLERELEQLGRSNGADDVSFPPTVGLCLSGSEPTEEVFNYADDQPLEAGTSVAFDVGFVADGYCSDLGRSFYVGEPEPHVEEAYRTLVTAVEETIDAIGSEIGRVDELFPHIEAVCDRAGYGEQLRNRHPDGLVGHQIGVEVHESPWLRPANDHELTEGMVFCLEPKLWHKGEYYLRVEEMVLVRDGEAEPLVEYEQDRFVIEPV